jgi:hypothetical protein
MEIKFTRPALSAMLAILLLMPGAACASAPVSFTVTGCVRSGIFVSERYTFQFGSFVDGAGWTPKSLFAYEGKTIRINGTLMPGDLLSGDIVVVDEICRPELHQGKFN